MENSENVIKTNKGVKEVLLWRLSAAVVWSVISQILILTVFLFIVNLNISHPLFGLKIVLNTLISWHTLFYLAPLGAIIFAQGVICSKEYISGNPFLATRFQIIVNVLSVRNIFLCGLHMLSGIMTSWLYLSLMNMENYNSVVKSCPIGGVPKCLNEVNLFLTMSGLWIGFFYFIKEHLIGVKNIFFPIIDQSQFLQIKSNIWSLFIQSVLNATVPVGYYLLLYYFYGGLLRSYILSFSYLKFEDEPIDTLKGLCQPMLIICATLFSTLFLFTMSVMEILFKVNLTRHHIFPVTTSTPNVLTLGEGICLGKLPIIQHLACLDLFRLATYDSKRRNNLFTVSQPGGHPYNWNAIATSSLCLIDDYIDSLRQATSPSNDLSDEIKSPPGFKNTYEPVIQCPNSQALKYEPTVYRLRNMKYTKYSEMSNDINKPASLEIIQNKYPLSEVFQNLNTKLVNYIRSIPGVHYMFGELQDAKIKFILSQGQPIIWATQGLSLLASKSFYEDSYGVVHKDLPSIITSLVKLSQTLDKLSKIPVYSGKKVLSRRERYYSQMQNALKSAVKRSLFNICNTFGPFINELPLSTETKLHVMTFMIKKET